MNSGKKYLNEIKQILDFEKNKDSVCISLYDLSQINKKINNKLNYYEEQLKYAVNQTYGEYANVYISSLNSLPSKLIVNFKFSGYWREYEFYKKNGRLIWNEGSSFDMGNFFKTLGGDRFLLNFKRYISKLYDYGSKYSGVRNRSDIKDVNQMYHVEIDGRGVTLYGKGFKVSFSNKHKKYIYEDYSNGFVSEHSSEIFKKIFVNINDCPRCIQKDLYQLRKKQCLNEDRIKKLTLLVNRIREKEN